LSAIAERRRLPGWAYAAAAIVLVGLAAAIELAMGRVPWCKCGMEVAVGTIIDDNLALTILMLVYPLEAVKRWQMGG
jgi:hypothetical protein